MPVPSIDHPQQQQAASHQGSSPLSATETHITSPQFYGPGNTTPLQQVPMMNRFHHRSGNTARPNMLL
jgi:hypothetical protein